MTTRTIERPKVVKLTEPAKAWRNRYVALRNVRCGVTGNKVRKGQPFWGRDTHPSKEIAEQKSFKDDQLELRTYGELLCEYLGAFPVEAS